MDRTGPGEVTLIFSPPTEQNYEYAYCKSNGSKKMMHLPTWKKEETLKVKEEEDIEAVNLSYGIWGGNIRALERFIQDYNNHGRKIAIERAEKELDL